MAEHQSVSTTVTGIPLYTTSNPAMGYPVAFSNALNTQFTRNVNTTSSSGNVHIKPIQAAILIPMTLLIILVLFGICFGVLLHYPEAPVITIHSTSVSTRNSSNETFAVDMNVVFNVLTMNLIGSMDFDSMHVSVFQNNACLANTSIMPFNVKPQSDATYAPANLQFDVMSNQLQENYKLVNLKLELAGKATYKSWTWRKSPVARIAAHLDGIGVCITGKEKNKVELTSTECYVKPFINIVDYCIYTLCMLIGLLWVVCTILWTIVKLTHRSTS